MKYIKTVLEVRIRLDEVPGWGHEPEDHKEQLQNHLEAMIPHYKPEVKFIRVEDEYKAEGK